MGREQALVFAQAGDGGASTSSDAHLDATSGPTNEMLRICRTLPPESVRLIKALFATGATHPRRCNSDGNTALHYACSGGHAQVRGEVEKGGSCM